MERYLGPTALNLDAVLYTLQTAPNLADPKTVWRFLRFIVVYPTLFSTVLTLITYPPNKLKRTTSHQKYIFAALVVFTMSSIAFFVHKMNLVSYIQGRLVQGTIFEKNYVAPASSQISFSKKNNVILLILESIETTYNDTEVFEQPLMPYLAQLASENIAFNQHQVIGTEWTIAGQTSYLFGIPHVGFITKRKVLETYDQFFPSAASLPEIFSSNGYNVTFLQGTNGDYAGTKNIFRTHAPEASFKDSVFLTKEAKEHQKDISKHVTPFWEAYSDRFIFNYAKDDIVELSKANKPFFYTIATITTHGPSGFTHADTKLKYNDIRDSYSQLDNTVENFISWIKKQEFSQETTIIILGDHLAMKTDIYDKFIAPNQDKRLIYNVFINPQQKLSSTTLRDAASFDMAPTILESAGATIDQHRLGIGVSLFSNQKTLLEQYNGNIEELNAELKKRSKKYTSLFYPKKQINE